MGMAGCYTLDLYCDNYHGSSSASTSEPPDGIHAWREFPHQYTDEYGSVCRANARKDGWVFKHDGTVLCPKCSGKKGKK